MTTFQRPALRAALDGISGILVTPFDADDAIATAPLQPVVDRAVAAGVHVLVANGNTGEYYGLQAHEAERMVHAAAECVAGRVPLLAGIGRSVHEACALARESRKAGADALMVHQPPDPFVAPRGVAEYVRRIADAGDGLPVVLYLRNDNIGMAAIESVCRIAGVIGVKWASPTPLVLAEAIRRDLSGAGGCGLSARDAADRRDAAVRRTARAGEQRHQRHGRQDRAADDGQRLRRHPPTVRLAADRPATAAVAGTDDRLEPAALIFRFRPSFRFRFDSP